MYQLKSVYIKNMKYEERLTYLKLPTLKYRRLRGDMILTYNMFKSGETNDKLLKRHTLHDNFQTRGHNRKLSKEHCRLDIRKKLVLSEDCKYMEFLTIKYSTGEKYKYIQTPF